MTDFHKRVRSLGRGILTVWTAIWFLCFGMGIYSACYFNFATEFIRINPVQLGQLEAVRELPGFLCAGVTAIAGRIAEPILGGGALLLMSAGLGAYALVRTVGSLMLSSFVWSVGLHSWFPLQSSLVLGLTRDGSEGRRLGQTASVGSIGMLSGMALVSLLGLAITYQVWFVIAAASVLVAGTCLFFVPRKLETHAKQRFVWKRRYGLYYALTLLEGCRKQVFMTFAIYALTREYHTTLRVVAALMLINNVVNMLGAPIVGKLIDRIGERRILMTSYSALILVFLGYASIRNAHVLYVLYCLDNLFFLSSPCLTTYIKKIAEPRDLLPTLSLGVTLNHTAAVLVPLIGGALWASLGYPVTFYGGAVIVAVSVYLASRVNTTKPTTVSTEATTV